MITHSVYCFECICGARIQSESATLICHRCKRRVEIEWHCSVPVCKAENGGRTTAAEIGGMAVDEANPARAVHSKIWSGKGTEGGKRPCTAKAPKCASTPARRPRSEVPCRSSPFASSFQRTATVPYFCLSQFAAQSNLFYICSMSLEDVERPKLLEVICVPCVLRVPRLYARMGVSICCRTLN